MADGAGRGPDDPGVHPPKTVVSPKGAHLLAERRFGDPPYWEAMPAP